MGEGKKYIAIDGIPFDDEKEMLQHNEKLKQEKEKKEKAGISGVVIKDSNSKENNKSEKTIGELLNSDEAFKMSADGDLTLEEGSVAILATPEGKVIGAVDSTGKLTLSDDATPEDIAPIEKKFKVNGKKLKINKEKRLGIDSETIKGMSPSKFKEYYKKNVLGIDEKTVDGQSKRGQGLGDCSNGGDGQKPTLVKQKPRAEARNLSIG